MLRLHFWPPPELLLIATTEAMWLDWKCVIDGAVAVYGITKFLQLQTWTLRKAWRPTNFFILPQFVHLSYKLPILNTNDDEAAVFLSENSGICIYPGTLVYALYCAYNIVPAMHVAYICNTQAQQVMDVASRLCDICIYACSTYMSGAYTRLLACDINMPAAYPRAWSTLTYTTTLWKKSLVPKGYCTIGTGIFFGFLFRCSQPAAMSLNWV